MNKKIILAGGTGLLGSALSNHLIKTGYQVVVLSRKTSNGTEMPKQVVWDGINKENWTSELEGAFGLINFTGKSIDCIHNHRNKKEITDNNPNQKMFISLE